MKIFDTSQLPSDGSGLSPSEVYWLYNGFDCCITNEIREKLLSQLDSTSASTYAQTLRLQAPFLEMMLRGLLVDERNRKQRVIECKDKLALLEYKFNRLCAEGLELTYVMNWRSPKQIKALFYDILGLPVVKKRGANGYAPSVDREALETLSLHFVGEIFANFILAMRDLGKQIGFLETKLDADKRIRCNFNLAGTNTGRLSSSFSDFGTGCVRASAEALTPNGWVKMSQLRDGDLIAQYSGGTITFVPCKMFSRDFDDKMYNISGEQFNLTITAGHRMLWRNYHDGEYKTTPAAEAAFKRQIYLPLSGEYVGGNLTVPPYLAMLMADFSRESTQWRGAFKKPRKILRFLTHMKNNSVEFSEQKASKGYRRFAVRGHENLPKHYGPWVLSLTPECAETLVLEAQHWDGHIRGKSFIFYTARPDEAEWFQTLCHLTGRSATLRETVNSDAAYGSNSIIYSVNVKPKTEAQIMEKHWQVVDYKGKIYCPQVPSSYWLVRDEGFISVTGNTNLQNIDRNLRYIFIPDPGKVFVNVDLEQGDSRNVGALAWNMFFESHGPEFAGSYLDACESFDLHTTVCRMCWPELAWGEDKSKWKAIAEQVGYRTYSYRDLAKKLGHGTNYLGQPPTMAKHSKVPQTQIELFQQSYFSAFPCIPAWQAETIRLLQETGQLTHLLGRRRYFFGRHNDQSVKNAAIAYCPQGMTGDIINEGILRLWRDPRFELLVQVHDSILIQIDQNLVNELTPEILRIMRVELPLLGGRTFSIPCEAKVGWNWGDVSDDNPHGMKKFKSEELRLPPNSTRRPRLNVRGLL